MNRNIFNDKPSRMEKALDIITAITIGLILVVLVMGYFDILLP